MHSGSPLRIAQTKTKASPTPAVLVHVGLLRRGVGGGSMPCSLERPRGSTAARYSTRFCFSTYYYTWMQFASFFLRLGKNVIIFLLNQRLFFIFHYDDLCQTFPFINSEVPLKTPLLVFFYKLYACMLTIFPLEIILYVSVYLYFIFIYLILSYDFGRL